MYSHVHLYLHDVLVKLTIIIIGMNGKDTYESRSVHKATGRIYLFLKSLMEVASTIVEGKLFHFLIILLAKYIFLTSVLVYLVKSLYEWPLVCIVVERSKNSMASRSTKPFGTCNGTYFFFLIAGNGTCFHE